MPRKVFHGRRGGKPRHVHSGPMDTKHLMNVLKGLQAAQDGQEDDAAALVANAPEGRHDGRSGRTTGRKGVGP